MRSNIFFDRQTAVRATGPPWGAVGPSRISKLASTRSPIPLAHSSLRLHALGPANHGMEAQTAESRRVMPATLVRVFREGR